MSLIFFVAAETPKKLCIRNEATIWHWHHGWVWNIMDRDFKPVGVFYCSRLGADGIFVHFDVLNFRKVSCAEIKCGIRKGLKMVSNEDVIYATIPKGKRKLISCAKRFGFRIVHCGGYVRNGEPICLLKFLTDEK